LPDVRLERKLAIPIESATEAVGSLLHAIARQEGPWRGFALHVGFGDLHLPDVGYVAVPIHLSVEKDGERPHAFALAFTSAHLPAAFPGLRGTIEVLPGSFGESLLLLTGTYELPMQLFGKLFDSAFMPGVAERSLENFVDEIAAACEARVAQREAEYARYHFYGRTPR
jgi:hypothetical protein